MGGAFKGTSGALSQPELGMAASRDALAAKASSLFLWKIAVPFAFFAGNEKKPAKCRHA